MGLVDGQYLRFYLTIHPNKQAPPPNEQRVEEEKEEEVDEVVAHMDNLEL